MSERDWTDSHIANINREHINPGYFKLLLFVLEGDFLYNAKYTAKCFNNLWADFDPLQSKALVKVL